MNTENFNKELENIFRIQKQRITEIKNKLEGMNISHQEDRKVKITQPGNRETNFKKEDNLRDL